MKVGKTSPSSLLEEPIHGRGSIYITNLRRKAANRCNYSSHYHGLFFFRFITSLIHLLSHLLVCYITSSTSPICLILRIIGKWLQLRSCVLLKACGEKDQTQSLMRYSTVKQPVERMVGQTSRAGNLFSPKKWAWRFLTVTSRTLHYKYFSCFSHTTSLLFVFCAFCLWWGFQWSAKCPGAQAQSRLVCIAVSKSKKPHGSNIARHNFNTRLHQGHPWSKDTSTRTCEVFLLNLGTLLGSKWSTKRERNEKKWHSCRVPGSGLVSKIKLTKLSKIIRTLMHASSNQKIFKDFQVLARRCQEAT